MNSGFYIFITVVRASSGRVTMSATQPDALLGEQEQGSEVPAGARAVQGGAVGPGPQLTL